jgi:uncharacterized membrane protein
MVWMNSATIPLVTALVLLGGGLVRHFYNVRHADHAKSPWWAWAVAAVAALVAFYVALSSSPAGRERLGLAPAPVPAVAGAAAAATVPKEAVEIVTGRCAMCHAAEPVWDGIGSPPKGVMLDTAERIAQQAAAIRMQSVLTHAMPPNNLTEMTPAERRVLAAWLNGPR